MGILTQDMQRVVREQRLGYIATVCPDGTPNLSPNGTVAVWDDYHLMFADIRSPQSVRNIEKNPAVEINVVDPLVRKGYRFKGHYPRSLPSTIGARPKSRSRIDGAATGASCGRESKNKTEHRAAS